MPQLLFSQYSHDLSQVVVNEGMQPLMRRQRHDSNTHIHHVLVLQWLARVLQKWRHTTVIAVSWSDRYQDWTTQAATLADLGIIHDHRCFKGWTSRSSRARGTQTCSACMCNCVITSGEVYFTLFASWLGSHAQACAWYNGKTHPFPHSPGWQQPLWFQYTGKNSLFSPGRQQL